ncbi:phosphopantetheine-binding protein [Streptomyces sp. NPDC090077]|uniref:phosphopantetheine-binding protein n=1 Tax=Streptomyces sp. NPDC090077 TaxID=3365938 RepID=UPI0038086179
MDHLEMTERLVPDSRDGLTAVMDAIVLAAGNAGVDDVVLARLRSLHEADRDTLLKSPAELGLDSLTWLEVLTVLEERFDVLLPDAVAVTPASRTVLGLARALADCRRAGR